MILQWTHLLEPTDYLEEEITVNQIWETGSGIRGEITTAIFSVNFYSKNELQTDYSIEEI